MPPQTRRPSGAPSEGPFAPIQHPGAEGIDLIGEATAIAPELARARRVLIDALRALAPQREAITLIGAQAVYEHTAFITSGTCQAL